MGKIFPWDLQIQGLDSKSTKQEIHQKKRGGGGGAGVRKRKICLLQLYKYLRVDRLYLLLVSLKWKIQKSLWVNSTVRSNTFNSEKKLKRAQLWTNSFLTCYVV